MLTQNRICLVRFSEYSSLEFLVLSTIDERSHDDIGKYALGVCVCSFFFFFFALMLVFADHNNLILVLIC